MKTFFTLLFISICLIPSLAQTPQAFYNVSSGNGNGLRFWSSDSYKIHMGNTAEYKYGPVTDYSIKMNMSSNSGRGWTWGLSGVTPIAALSNSGNMQIAGSFTAVDILSNKLLLNDPNTLADWDMIWQSGFFEGYNKLNAPESYGWFWGINLGHTSNSSTYRYGAQILIKNYNIDPEMYFRSRGKNGDGVWAKVLHNVGNQSITGNFGIGVTNPTERLEVAGTVLATEVKVQNVPQSDYVFEPEYNLRPITEVETFIKENKHLPDIPSAQEFKENGVGLGEMDDMLLRKVEELTLYVIEQQKEIRTLKSENIELKDQNAKYDDVLNSMMNEVQELKNMMK